MSETTEERPCFRVIRLEFPKTVDGIDYTEITLRRLTAKQVSEWVEEVRLLAARDPMAKTPDLPTIDAPQKVLDALDDDDLFTLEEASADFLPRRFRDIRNQDKQKDSPLVTGKHSAPSSVATSAGA